MNILVINTLPLTIGGITIHILNYLKHIKTEGCSIDIFSYKRYDEDIIKSFESIGCRIIYMPNRKREILKYIMRLREILRRKKYDIIHIHGNSATMLIELLYSYINKIPIRIAHCHNSICSHPILNAMLSPIFRKLYTQAIACSEKAGCWLFGKGNFEILYNAIEIEKYKFSIENRNIYRKKMGIEDNQIVIGHIGNFCEQKNHLFLIRMFHKFQKKNKDSRLYLIGTGGLQNEIRDTVKEFQLEQRVSFLNIRNDIPQLLQMMDVFVLPSRWEGLPVALVEAQAAMLPCIVSDKVSKEIKLTQGVKFLSLDDTMDKWIDGIVNISKMNRYAEDDFDKLKMSDYNIIIATNKLKKIYGID